MATTACPASGGIATSAHEPRPGTACPTGPGQRYRAARLERFRFLIRDGDNTFNRNFDAVSEAARIGSFEAFRETLPIRPSREIR